MRIAHRVNPQMTALRASAQVEALKHNELLSFPVDHEDIYLIMLHTRYYDGSMDKAIQSGLERDVDEIVVSENRVTMNYGIFWSRDIVKAALDRGMRFVVLLTKLPTVKGVMESYRRIAYDKRVSGVAFHCDCVLNPESAPYGWDRLYLIKCLVDAGIFNPTIKHRLLEVINPAELVAYKRAFSNFVCNSIDVAITSLCYVYSLYGIRLSRDVGLFHNHLHFSKKLLSVPYSRYEQEDLFFLNQEIMDAFSMGIGGDGLMSRYDKQARSLDLDIDLGVGDDDEEESVL